MLGNNMNLCAKGESSQVVPPGFRFHPTEEELLNYYLRKKLKSQKIDLDVIPDIDLNKLEPWDIREKCKIGSTMQNEWYLFSHKDKKYPTGTRTNRATASGFWKATGRDKVIYTNLKRIGMRKTLVFYTGRAPHGQKSDWIMHEYRLDGDNTSDSLNVLDISGESGPEEGWVVCRIFKKKKHQKALDDMSPPVSIPPNKLMHVQSSSRKKQENESINSCRQIIHNNNQYLPSESFQQLAVLKEIDLSMNPTVHNPSGWGAIDQLVASQLNGHNYFDEQLPGYVESIVNEDLLLSQDMDLWSFTRTSAPLTQASDPLSHLSV